MQVVFTTVKEAKFDTIFLIAHTYSQLYCFPVPNDVFSLLCLFAETYKQLLELCFIAYSNSSISFVRHKHYFFADDEHQNSPVCIERRCTNSSSLVAWRSIITLNSDTMVPLLPAEYTVGTLTQDSDNMN